MDSPGPGARRRADIDSLRVIGTLLVFLFHALQPFNPLEEWHIRNPQRSETIGFVLEFLNIWIMPLFVFLAGSSMFFALQRRSNAQFLKERTLRVFIPLIFGIFFFVAPQVYAERVLTGAFHGSFLDFYPHFFEGEYPKGNMSWHHLWFLAYLFVYSVFGLAVFRFFQSERGEDLLSRMHARLNSPLSLVAFAIPLMIFQMLLQWDFPRTNALFDDWNWHAQLFTCFLFGYVFVSHPRISDLLRRSAFLYLTMSILVTVIYFSLRQIDLSASDSSFGILVNSRGALYRLAMWTWILAIMGYGDRYLSEATYFQGYFSEASLPFYILHQTLIVGVAFFVVQLDVGIFVKVPMLMFLSFVLTLGVYECLRRWNPTRFVLGLKPRN